MNVIALQGAAWTADNAWQAELTRRYGRKAGDARYDERGIATPELLTLRDAKRAADEAWHAAVKATWIYQ